LVAGLILSGPAWGQTGTICVRDGVTWNSLGGRCDEERAGGMGAPSGGAAGCPAPSILLNGQCVVVIGSAAGCYSSTPTKDKLKAMQQPSGPAGMGFGTTSCRAGRSYTPAEIDRMREAVRKHMGWGEGQPRLMQGAMLLEQRLQTYIAAGITAEELEKQ